MRFSIAHHIDVVVKQHAESVQAPQSDRDMDKLLSYKETFWIHKHQTESQEALMRNYSLNVSFNECFMIFLGYMHARLG